jgi:outer membrane receptor protein involved in Fe transport
VLATFAVDNLFNKFYVPYLNAAGLSEPGQPPGIFFPAPGITLKGSLRIRFGVT